MQMQRYIATAVCRLSSGRVAINAEQARRRLHNLRPVDADDAGGGVFEIVRPIEFKRAERFGYDGEMPKALADLAVPPESSIGQAVRQAEGRRRAASPRRRGAGDEPPNGKAAAVKKASGGKPATRGRRREKAAES